MKHRLSVSCVAGLIFACACLLPAGARDGGLDGGLWRDAIAGTWTLVSIYEEDELGEEIDRWGDRPTGRFVTDASGHFMLQIVGRDAIEIAMRAPLLAPQLLDDRRILSYAGRLTIDEATRKLTFRIEDAFDTAWESSRPSAELSISGDTLHFVSAAETSPTGAFHVHLVWQRAR